MIDVLTILGLALFIICMGIFSADLLFDLYNKIKFKRSTNKLYKELVDFWGDDDEEDD